MFTTGGEAVDDVAWAVPAIPLIRCRDAHGDARTHDRPLDGALDLGFERVGRCSAANENLLLAEPVECHGIAEAARGDPLQEGKTRWMNIDRSDVPALEGAVRLLPALASPGADRLRREPRGNALGLPVGIELDVPTVRRDSDESFVAAVVFEPLDELAVGLRLDGSEGRVRHPRRERAGELAACAEALAAAHAHAHDGV